MFVDIELLMTEMVECFFVCHWAVSYNKLAKKHVSRATTNAIEVIRDGSCRPRELYGSLIETLSKDWDLIIDIGNANGNLNYHTFIFHDRKMVYMYCRRDPSLSVFLSFLREGIRTHVDMQLSLCLLVIDIIDFSIILETNIHNRSDLLIHLTNEI